MTSAALALWRTSLAAATVACCAQSAIRNPQSEIPIIEYLVHHSGYAGWMGNRLTIYRSGMAVLHGTLGKEGVGAQEKGRLQLEPDELTRLLTLIEDVKFLQFKDQYGREPTVNPGEVRILYRWDRKTKQVIWRDAPSPPGPPAGWARIVEVLEGIRSRLRRPSE